MSITYKTIAIDKRAASVIGFLRPVTFFAILGSMTDSVMAQPVMTIKNSSELSNTVAMRAWEQGPRPSTIPKLLCVGVVVRNQSQFPIAAVMVKATILRIDQRVETRWLLRHNFDDGNVLLPGRQYLVSPFGVPVAHALETDGVDARFQQPLEEALAEAREWKEVSIEIDSVLDNAGRLRGIDSSDSFRLFSEWLRADREVVDQLLDVRDRAGGATEILKVLTQANVSSTTSFQKRDHYGKRWSRSAQLLLRQLDLQGPQAVFSEAERRRALNKSRVIFR